MAALDCRQLEKPAKATAPIAGRGVLLALAGPEKILLADLRRRVQRFNDKRRQLGIYRNTGLLRVEEQPVSRQSTAWARCGVSDPHTAVSEQQHKRPYA